MRRPVSGRSKPRYKAILLELKNRTELCGLLYNNDNYTYSVLPLQTRFLFFPGKGAKLLSPQQQTLVPIVVYIRPTRSKSNGRKLSKLSCLE